MARSTLTPQAVATTGLHATYTAADALGSLWNGSGDEVLHVKNDGGVSVNVTITTGGTLGGEPVADKVVAVPAGEDRFIGRFRPDIYNQPSGADAGKVYVDFSAVASVTVALLSV